MPLRLAPPRVGFPHGHDPIGLAVRQRLEQDRAHHAEHRGGGADAERKRQQRWNREARRAQERAHAEPQVPHERVKVRFPSNVAHVIFDGFGAAHFSPSRAHGGVTRQPGRHLRLDRVVQVRTQLLVEITLGLASSR